MTRKIQGEESDNNLVMFPASKNFKVNLEDRDLGRDPLHDLLNEYSHVKDEDIPSYLDDRFDDRFESDDFADGSFPVGDTFNSLEAYMNRHKNDEALTPDDLLVKRIVDRLKAIGELKERIKYYLDEIETFLPAKRK